MSVQGVTSCFVEQRLGHSLLSIVPMSVQGVTGCFVHTPAWTFHVFFSTFFRLTSDFDNFGFFQAPGSNPQGSNPTNERVEYRINIYIYICICNMRTHNLPIAFLLSLTSNSVEGRWLGWLASFEVRVLDPIYMQHKQGLLELDSSISN